MPYYLKLWSELIDYGLSKNFCAWAFDNEKFLDWGTGDLVLLNDSFSLFFLSKYIDLSTLDDLNADLKVFSCC